ncbi:hypothetical protein PoB_005869200 [Plakobranchus ocellatus]|uniref:Uncharacterized protein n=1 Tax=Plakobranchus ocellatus TaxID=259542 RepID=A0AAV4CKE7_9GAST|nr:hypothetical protein PoB_005869200 [Plakobranchus ocellatus]
MSGLNPGTVGAIVLLTIDQSQARRLGIDFSTREVKSLGYKSQCSSPPSPISPTGDITSQCPSPPSAISHIGDITR